MTRSVCGLLLLLLAPLPSLSALEESEAERLLDLSRTASPTVRPQAADRLIALGDEAVPVIRRIVEREPGGLAALGSDLLEVLGRLPADGFRSELWAAVRDPEFPWRPASARSLASTARAEELDRFVTLLDDPVAAVRASALDALEALDHRKLPLVEARLKDDDDRVRRTAAGLLARWGQPWALAWPLEELKREDRYFEIDTGKSARFAAMKLLRDTLGETFGYKAHLPWTDETNRNAKRKLDERFESLVAGKTPRLPRIARAGTKLDGVVLGLEIRSCRRGEFFLRWTSGDKLYVGTGNPVKVDLPDGATARLVSELGDRLAPLGDRRLWGEPGCDREVYRWARDGKSTRPETFVLSKGAAAVEGLRPAELAGLARDILQAIPDQDLRSRILDALESVGGPLTPATKD